MKTARWISLAGMDSKESAQPLQPPGAYQLT